MFAMQLVWACDECSNPLAVAAEAKEAGLSVEEWLACRVSGRECNPLTVAAERAEAEEAGLSVEEWRETVAVWVSRKFRRHLGQAAGKRLVSGRLCARHVGDASRATQAQFQAHLTGRNVSI